MWRDRYDALKRSYALSGEPAEPTRGRILFWTMTCGSMEVFAQELYLALALRNHGYDAIMVLCDGCLGACIIQDVMQNKKGGDWDRVCTNCREIGSGLMQATGLPFVSAGDLLEEPVDPLSLVDDDFDLSRLEDYAPGGIRIGLHAVSSVVRYARSPAEYVLGNESEAEIRRFLGATLLSAKLAQAAVDRFRPDMMAMSQGVYAEWGPCLEVAHQNNIQVIRHQAGLVKNSLMIKRSAPGDFYSPIFVSQAEWEQKLQRGLATEDEQELDAVLQDYGQGDLSREKYFDGATETPEAMARRLGLPEDKPVWGLFSHLTWDAHLVGKMAHADVTTWLSDTFRTMAEVTDVHWVVKLHPSENINATRYGAQQICREVFGDEPPEHMTIIPPQERINTPMLQRLLSGGVTIRGTAGLEMAVQGKPVILSGKCHYGEKGFTYDCHDVDSYRAHLRKAAELSRLSDEQLRTARTYGHLFYCRRQFPLAFDDYGVRLHKSSHADFQPGRDPQVDWLVEQLTTEIEQGSRAVMNRKEQASD